MQLVFPKSVQAQASRSSCLTQREPLVITDWTLHPFSARVIKEPNTQHGFVAAELSLVLRHSREASDACMIELPFCDPFFELFVVWGVGCMRQL